MAGIFNCTAAAPTAAVGPTGRSSHGGTAHRSIPPTLLSAWQASLRGVGPALPFILDARTFRTTPLPTLTSMMGAIDLLDQVPGVGDDRAAHANSEPVQIGAVEFRTLTLEALIASKQAVRRKKDLGHLIEPEAILGLRRERGR